MTNTADEGRANLLEKVTAYISKHTIYDLTAIIMWKHRFWSTEI